MRDAEKDAKVYLEDMLGAIAKIKKFTAGMSKGRFRANKMAFDATVRNLEILGEAASKLPSSFRNENKGIEWARIIGMRNRLIHAYDDVNFDIVWSAVKYDVPDLERKLKAIKQ